MGFTPQDVDCMSLWQFSACVQGYAAANGGGSGGMDDTDAARLSAAMDRMGI